MTAYDAATRETTEQLIIGAVAALLDYVLEPLDLTTDDVCYPVLAKEESEAIGAQASYECCTFRGSIVALDGTTGAQLWKTYTIQEKPMG